MVHVLQMFIKPRCGTSLGGYIRVAKRTMCKVLMIKMMSGAVQPVKRPKVGCLATRLNKMMDKIRSSSIFSSCCRIFSSTNRLGRTPNLHVRILHSTSRLGCTSN
jgi:hypothetical protein